MLDKVEENKITFSFGYSTNSLEVSIVFCLDWQKRGLQWTLATIDFLNIAVGLKMSIQKVTLGAISEAEKKGEMQKKT